MATAADVPIIDGLRLVGDWTAASTHRQALARAGIDRVVLCAERGASTEEVAGYVAQHAEGCRFLARANPRTDPPAWIDRWSDQPHCVGFYLDPEEDGYRITSPQVGHVVAAIDYAKLPVVIAAGLPNVSEALQIGALARRFPEITFAMTNGGHMNISGLGQSEAYAAMDQNPNLVIYTTGVYRQDFLQNAMARYGAGRVLFGTHREHYSVDYELARVLGAQCSPDARRTVLAGVAQRLFFDRR